jgi:hypothetical protein
MVRLAGIDLSGWHDWGARNWSSDDPDVLLHEPDVVDGGIASVVVQEQEGEFIGGPQAALSPHGRGTGWGDVGDPSRRRSIRDVLQRIVKGDGDGRIEAALLQAAISALTAGANRIVFTIPDRQEFSEAVQARLLKAAQTRGRGPRAVLLWRPVAAILDALNRGLLNHEFENRQIGVLAHDEDGLNFQTLRLRRLQEHPDILMPERVNYGVLLAPEVGLANLYAEIDENIRSHNLVLAEPNTEQPRLASRILLEDKPKSDPEIIRRGNGTWATIMPPPDIGVDEFMPRALEIKPAAESDELAGLFVTTPLTGRAAFRMKELVCTAFKKPVTCLPSECIARGALEAARRIHAGIPHYLDRLDSIALLVMKGREPQFEDLVPPDATVPANRIYVSRPISGLFWRKSHDHMQFYIKKGGQEIRRWETDRIDAPAVDEPVQIELSQQPAQGWALVEITAPEWDFLKRNPIRLDWDSLPPEERDEEEIKAELRRPLPGIPRRVIYRAHEALWGPVERPPGPGLSRALDRLDLDDDASIDVFSRALRTFIRFPGHSETYFAVSTDGELPHKLVGTGEEKQFERAIERMSWHLLTAIQERRLLTNNRRLQCVTWVFTRCPEKLQDAMLDAVDTLNHPLRGPQAAQRVILHGLGRTVSKPQRIRAVIERVLDLPQNSDTRACIAALLSRRPAAPAVLDKDLIFRIGNNVLEALRTQQQGRTFERDFKYTLFVLAGLLRCRHEQPYALLADRPGLGRELKQVLENIEIRLSQLSGAAASRAQKIALTHDLIEYLSGEGGDPNILYRIDALTEE